MEYLKKEQLLNKNESIHHELLILVVGEEAMVCINMRIFVYEKIFNKLQKQ